MRISDKRNSGFFIIDNEVLDDYDLNVYEIAIYALLVKFSGEKGECYPSLNTISSKLKISKPTIINNLKSLELKSLICILKNKTGGGYDNNVYIIEPVKKKVVNEVNHMVNDVDHSGKPDLPEVVNEVYSNKTHINKTHNKDISGLPKPPSKESKKTFFKTQQDWKTVIKEFEVFYEDFEKSKMIWSPADFKALKKIVGILEPHFDESYFAFAEIFQDIPTFWLFDKDLKYQKKPTPCNIVGKMNDLFRVPLEVVR